MKCKKCGNNIEKEWKYCPICSRGVNKERNIIIFSMVILIIVIGIVILIIKGYLPMNSNYLERVLEKKYNENFDNIVLISSVKNSDTDLSCDGSSFGTIKGKGKKEYYKLHSNKNDLYFWAYYDTSNKSKGVVDNYEILLNRKSIINEIYNYVNYNFFFFFNKITLSYNLNQEAINILSSDQLNSILTNIEDESIPKYFNTMYDEFNIYIDQDIFEYSKSNYSKISDLNNKLVSSKNKYYFSIILNFNNNATISLDGLNGKAYVYDKFDSQHAWGETLEEFIMRENY